MIATNKLHSERKHRYAKTKINMGLGFIPTYVSRDTAHAQAPNWRDPTVYSQNAVT